MREILFRAKRMDTGEWIECLPSYNVCDGDITEIETLDSGFITVDPETLCQYTGALDRNGQKIFEGDIVLRNMSKRMYKKGVAVWINIGVCGFWLKCQEGSYAIGNDEWEGKSIADKVIGNIYDNPERLEGGLSMSIGHCGCIILRKEPRPWRD